MNFKYLLLALFMMGCTPLHTIHGVADVSNWSITKENEEYKLLFYVHVGKDVDYITVNYYVEDELLYSSYKNVPNKDAQKTIGILEGIYISEPTTLKIVVTSYMGDTFYDTDTKTFFKTIP